VRVLLDAKAATKVGTSQLLRGRPDPIFVVPFEQGEIGPDLFWAALSVSAPPLLAEG
jgi:hypothetical protein